MVPILAEWFENRPPARSVDSFTGQLAEIVYIYPVRLDKPATKIVLTL